MSQPTFQLRGSLRRHLKTLGKTTPSWLALGRLLPPLVPQRRNLRKLQRTKVTVTMMVRAKQRGMRLRPPERMYLVLRQGTRRRRLGKENKLQEFDSCEAVLYMFF
jgi:hypothetical protein